MTFNERVAKRLYKEMVKGQKRVVTSEEFEGTNKSFIKEAEKSGLKVKLNGYTVVVEK